MSFVVCKNPLNMSEHYILSSASVKGRLFDHLQYCGVCRKLAFTDNFSSPNPEDVKYQKPFVDSKINPNSGPCGVDTL